MDAEDMIVLVVVGEDEAKSSIATTPEIKIELEHSSDDSQDINVLIETAEKHGEYIPLHVKPSDDYHSVYGENELSLRQEINSEQEDDGEDFDNSPDKKTNVSDCDESVQDIRSVHCESKNKCLKKLKPHMRRSFIAVLRKEYPELREDEKLLIDTLEQIMRSMKPPPPPRDYYVMNGFFFQCVICGKFTNSLPAASRHYQERHGERYLACYACGMSFRSATVLFKHEKRCVAPDATIVLRARAAFVGSKGRSRPFLPCREKSRAKPKFSCKLCSAQFVTLVNLESHENLHRGERPYRCEVCPYAYTSSYALARHKRMHSDIQFICDQCGRSFKVKGALIVHMETHNPIRKYGCSECSRRFSGKAALVRHVDKIHRNLPPPCACQICPKRYPHIASLKNHMKREHGMSIMTRTMFFKSLPTMTDLEVKESKVITKSDTDFIIQET